MTLPHPTLRRRRWPWRLAVLAVIIAGLWTALWHYAAATVESTIVGWRAREAKAGYLYTCATQTIGGFPFHIEVRCTEPAAELRTARPPTTWRWKELRIVAQVFQPTRLVGELTGPLLIGAPGQPASLTAHWRQARVSMEGLPTAPERVIVTLDAPNLKQPGAGGGLFRAKRLELAGRMAGAASNPAIEFTLVLTDASAPLWHPAAVAVDAEIAAVLRGLKDFAPKPWTEWLRDIARANGRLEITKARLRQGETVALASGELGLNARGRLNGQLRMTIANLEKLLAALGLERFLTRPASGQLDAALSALDRLSPGLGNLMRQNAGPAVAAGLGALGQPTELEGKRAFTLPLRFADGEASFGPIPLGMTPPLF